MPGGNARTVYGTHTKMCMLEKGQSTSPHRTFFLTGTDDMPKESSCLLHDTIYTALTGQLIAWPSLSQLYK